MDLILEVGLVILILVVTTWIPAILFVRGINRAEDKEFLHRSCRLYGHKVESSEGQYNTCKCGTTWKAAP